MYHQKYLPATPLIPTSLQSSSGFPSRPLLRETSLPARLDKNLTYTPNYHIAASLPLYPSVPLPLHPSEPLPLHPVSTFPAYQPDLWQPPLKKRRKKFDFSRIAESATQDDEEEDEEQVAPSFPNEILPPFLEHHTPASLKYSLPSFAQTPPLCMNFSGDTSKNKKPIPVESEKERPKKDRPKKEFVCKFCQKLFLRRYYLLVHERTHTDETPYICKICQMSFRRRNHLIEHQCLHSEERPFKCQKCEKCFAYIRTLFCHYQIVHTEDRPFKCSVCYKAFKTQGNMKSHLIIHSDVKPFICSSCGKGYKTSSDLRRHNWTDCMGNKVPIFTNTTDIVGEVKRLMEANHLVPVPHPERICSK